MLLGSEAKPVRVGTSLATGVGVGRPHALTPGAVRIKHLHQGTSVSTRGKVILSCGCCDGMSLKLEGPSGET